MLRSLSSAKGHAAVVVLTLGLAIGAVTSIASVVYGVLLRPLAFPDQDRLFMLWQRAPGLAVEEDWFSIAQYFDLVEQVPAFESLALIFGSNVTLTGDDLEPERVGALRVSSSFFDMLRVEPSLGRPLRTEDDLPGSTPKVLLGPRLFEERFRSDPAMIGRSIVVDGERLEVIGVLPRVRLDAEAFPTLATIPIFDLITSLPVEDPQRTTNGSENYNILAKLAPGVGREQLDAELLAASAQFVQEEESLGSGLAAGTEYRIDAVPLLDEMVGPARRPLLALLAAAVGLLLIACANVANLLFARAARQKRERAVQTALGASPARLARASLLESTALGGLGAIVGFGAAFLAIFYLRVTAPNELPRLADVSIDARALAFAAGVGLMATLLFGLGPALRAAHAAPRDALSEASLGARARSSWRGVSFVLVVLQVALSLTLVVGAGLLARTYLGLLATDPGFRADGTLTFRVSLVGERYDGAEERIRFLEELFDRVRSLPGVRAAGGVRMLPMTRGYAWTDFHIEGRSAVDNRDRVVADLHVVTPGYFEAMGIPLRSGRSFARADTPEAPVVVVNRAFATTIWRSVDVVGRLIGRDPGEWETIVGVTEDIKHYGLDQETRLAVFYPYAARPGSTVYGVVRVESGVPDALAPAVASVVRELDPNLPAYDVQLMSERVRASLARRRLTTSLFHAFAGISLLLATLGLYGVLSFTVASHTREMGIRKALGARREDLYRLVFRGAGRVALLGIVVGTGIAVAGARFFEGLVYGVSALDPVVFGLAVVLVAFFTVFVSYLPARRAARVDPIQVLKDE